MSELNDELLKTDEPVAAPKSPKRNTKNALIKRIVELSEKCGMELKESDTQLKRMSKEKLQQKLADIMEQEVREQMQEQVCGHRQPVDNHIMSLGALRMCHNIVVSGGEQIFNNYIGPHLGVELDGFSDRMRDPRYQQTIDEILIEISNENPEVLQYFSSPYARLFMVWLTCATTSMKKKVVRKQNNVRNMESSKASASLRPGSMRRPQNGQVVRNVSSHPANTRTI